MSSGNATALIFALTSVLLSPALFRRLRSASANTKIRGPKSPSFAVGNFLELNQNEAGKTDLKWFEEYGLVVSYKGTFGQDRLLIADPKALHHIYNSPNFCNDIQMRELASWVSGKGLVWAEGDVHKRQRKVIMPAFSTSEIKISIPIFRRAVQRMLLKWQDIVSHGESNIAILNVHDWMVRGTLDALGEAAFDYRFETIENDSNELAQSYHNLAADFLGHPDALQSIIQGLPQFFPFPLLQLMKLLPAKGIQRGLHANKTAKAVAKDLISLKKVNLDSGVDISHDLMGVLLKANAASQPSARLSDDEVFSQLGTFLIAGHETTANTLSWALFELARNSDIQVKLRAEVRAAQAAAGGELSITDMATVPYLEAVVKEVIRLYPVAASTEKEAAKDDIVPLAVPIKLASGEIVSEFHVGKGTKLQNSFIAYNRLKQVWGDDAEVFNPERWLNNSKQKESNLPAFGIYSGIGSFASGPKSCIGWRFAVLEIQTFVAEIISIFELSLAPGEGKIRRSNCGLLVPMVEGEWNVKLPLSVSMVD